MEHLPVDFPADETFIEMSVMNVAAGPVNPAGFACEIYDMTAAQLIAATSALDLNIIFKTLDMVGEPFDVGTTIGYSC